jgi:hypothetical protein
VQVDIIGELEDDPWDDNNSTPPKNNIDTE